MTIAAKALPAWVQLLPPAGSVLVAAVVAFIAWQQWRTAHNKLAFDLFDKRYSLYLRYSDLLNRRHAEVHHYPQPFKPDIFRWRDYYIAEHEVKLLFGADVEKIVNTLDEALTDLESQHNRLLESGAVPGSLMDHPDFKKANGEYVVAGAAFERHIRSYISLGHMAQGRVPKREWWEA